MFTKHTQAILRENSQARNPKNENWRASEKLSSTPLKGQNLSLYLLTEFHGSVENFEEKKHERF